MQFFYMFSIHEIYIIVASIRTTDISYPRFERHWRTMIPLHVREPSNVTDPLD